MLSAKPLQSCPTLCNPIDGSPPGSPVPGILQARTLEWAAISFSNAWKWKVKVKSLSRVGLIATPWSAAYQAPPSMGFFQARVLEGLAIAFSILPARLLLTYCSEAWKGVFISLLSQKDLWAGRAEFSWSRRPTSLDKMPVLAPSAYRAWSSNTVGCGHTSVHWIIEAWISISDETDGEPSSCIPRWREDTAESCCIWWLHRLCSGLGSARCPTDSWCLSALD